MIAESPRTANATHAYCSSAGSGGFSMIVAMPS